MPALILLIDADDTLLDFKKAEYTSITHTFKKFGVTDLGGAARLFSAIAADHCAPIRLKTLPIVLKIILISNQTEQ